MSSGWSGRAHQACSLLLPSLHFHLMPPLLSAFPFAIALSECISALLLLLAQRLPSAHIPTLVIAQPSDPHLWLRSLSTCPWLSVRSHPHRRKWVTSWCDKSYETSEMQAGGTTFRVPVPGKLELCKAGHEREPGDLLDIVAYQPG